MPLFSAMWFAIAGAQILQNSIYVILLLRFNWEAEVVKVGQIKWFHYLVVFVFSCFKTWSTEIHNR